MSLRLLLYNIIMEIGLGNKDLGLQEPIKTVKITTSCSKKNLSSATLTSSEPLHLYIHTITLRYTQTWTYTHTMPSIYYNSSV